MLFEMFHDQGKGFISSIEPTKNDEVIVRLRTTKNSVDEAYVLFTDKGDNWQRVLMKKVGPDKTGYYEFFEGVIPPMENNYYYCFCANDVYLSAMGVDNDMPVAMDCFAIMPGFKTPDWAKGILWYSIMPDTFFNGDILNDSTETGLRKTVPWGAALRGLYEYYGGDIAGIKSKLDYVKEFYADGIYVNPLWTSESNAGYGPNSYFETSVNYGNEEEFADLIRSTHEKGLRFLMDAVFSYSQANSIYTNSNGHQPLPGAFESEDSEYFDMFEFKKWPNDYTHKWGGIENNLGSEKSRDVFWKGKDSVLHRYARAPYNADGYRFDAITSFAGKDTDLVKIGKEIRKCVKEEHPEVVLIGEDYGAQRALSANWDAFQNSFFLFSAKLWFKQGQFDQSWLLERMNLMSRLPRALGLCQYNNYDLHDVERLINDYSAEKYKIKGVWLLQMTFIGSPVIYYGDEMGAKKETGKSRNCFNWNQSEWNQELIALSKTLGKLRKEYTALKDGVIKVGVTDDEREITVFGRWDDNGNVVTMLNQKDYSQEMLLDLKQYNIVDGTIMTDYLMGKQYKVENGKAVVEIPAGGSILVTGKAGDYRNTLKILNGEYAGCITALTKNSYEIKECSENIRAAMPIFGQGYIEAQVCGEGNIVISDGLEGKKVTAHIGDKEVRITDTKNNIVYETNIEKGSLIKIQMTKSGCISLFVNGESVKENICPLVRTEQLYAGIEAKGGYVIFEKVKIENGPITLCDDFSMKHLQNLLSVYKACGDYYLKDEKLYMNSDKLSMLLTDEKSGDFTFKAKIVDNVNGYAGVVSYCDDKNGVVLVKKEKNIIFGILRDDEIIPWDSEECDSKDGIVLQLQRVGNVYQAVYIDGDKIKQFSSPLMANMSVARAGVICANGTAGFEYTCFGNSIFDGHTYNTPITIADNDWKKYSDEIPDIRRVEQYNIIGKKEEWEYAPGGIRRNEIDGLSQMAITNKRYTNFKAQATLLRREGHGEIGITFLRSCIDETLGDGYILCLNKDDILTLKYRDKVIKEKNIEGIHKDFGLRITVIRDENRLYIYTGQNRELFVYLEEVSTKSGYIGFYMDNVSGNINNRMVADYAPKWLEPISPWAQNIGTDEKGLIVKTSDLTMANLRGVAYTNVQVEIRLVLDVCDDNKEAYAGLLFGATQDIEPQRGGVLVALNQDGKLFISKMGDIKAETKLGTNVKSAMIIVTSINGCYQVKLPYTEDAILTWSDDEYQGGVLSLVSENSKTGFYHLNINDLNKDKCKGDKEYSIYRNGYEISYKDEYVESDSENVTYSIESGRLDNGGYLLEMDIQVCNAFDEKAYPTIFFRNGNGKKLGFYTGEDCSKLVGKTNVEISDVAAEPMWNFGKRVPNEKWHVAIETQPNKVSVKVNGAYIFKNVTLNDCLSGDYSNLAFIPEIVCRNEKCEKNIISNIRISEL